MPQNRKDTKFHKMEFDPIPKELEIIGKKIVDAAYTVKRLGYLNDLFYNLVGFRALVPACRQAVFSGKKNMNAKWLKLRIYLFFRKL